MKNFILSAMLCLMAYSATAQGTKTCREGNQIVTRSFDLFGRIIREVSTPLEIYVERGNRHVVKDPNAYSNLTASDGNIVVTETRNMKGQILNRVEIQKQFAEPKREPKDPGGRGPASEPRAPERNAPERSASDRHADYLDRSLGGRD